MYFRKMISKGAQGSYWYKYAGYRRDLYTKSGTLSFGFYVLGCGGYGDLCRFSNAGMMRR